MLCATDLVLFVGLVFPQVYGGNHNESVDLVVRSTSHFNCQIRELAVASESCGALGRNELEERLRVAWRQTLVEIANRKEARLPIERFLGFLEGCLNTEIPKTFEHRMCEAYFHEDDVVRIISVGSPFKQSTIGPEIMISATFNIERYEDVWFLTGENTKIPLVDFDAEHHRIRIGSGFVYLMVIAVAETGSNSAVLVFCEDAPQRHTVALLDAKGVATWVSEIKCQPPEDLTNTVRVGMINGTTEVVIKGQRVLVFGIANGIAYLEGFDLKNGDNIFRFSTEE